MSWIVPRGWIDHLMNALHENGLQSLFSCSRPRPLEHGCYVQAAKLTANGTVKTFGVGGPNVLDMIGD